MTDFIIVLSAIHVMIDQGYNRHFSSFLPVYFWISSLFLKYSLIIQVYCRFFYYLLALYLKCNTLLWDLGIPSLDIFQDGKHVVIPIQLEFSLFKTRGHSHNSCKSCWTEQCLGKQYLCLDDNGSISFFSSFGSFVILLNPKHKTWHLLWYTPPA